MALSQFLSWFRRGTSPPAAEAAKPPAADRSPEHMIAGCEYELRQMRREMLRRRSPPVPPVHLHAKSEPFVMFAGLRNRAYREALGARRTPP